MRVFLLQVEVGDVWRTIMWFGKQFGLCYRPDI